MSEALPSTPDLQAVAFHLFSRCADQRVAFDECMDKAAKSKECEAEFKDLTACAKGLYVARVQSLEPPSASSSSDVPSRGLAVAGLRMQQPRLPTNSRSMHIAWTSPGECSPAA